jgi:prephenate dehydratase
MKIAYQGVPGAYSEQASRALFGADCKVLPCETFEAVFEAVEQKRADRGVIPIENSLGGSIHQNYDLLLRHALSVTRETYVRVEHALLAPPGLSLRDIREVRSHPQALAQCSDFLLKHRAIKPVVWFDTAGAAASLSGASLAKDPVEGVAAIASEAAGKLYGLKVLQRALQNRAVNYTRFLCIARSPEKSAEKEGAKAPLKTPLKTSLTFVPARNQSGVLHKITGLFADRDIDLSKIESRPDPEKPFDYRFYLDISGGPKDAPVRAALAELKKLTSDLRVLGSYAKANLPRSVSTKSRR